MRTRPRTSLGGRLDELLEDQSTTLYSDTGYDDQPAPPSARVPESRAARLAIEELSEEEHVVPVELSTMDRQPTPAPAKRLPDSAAIAPPPPMQVQPATLVTAEPASARPGSVVDAFDVDLRWLVAAVGGLFTLFIVAAGYGLVDKNLANQERARTANALITFVAEQHSVIEALDRAGAADTDAIEAPLVRVRRRRREAEAKACSGVRRSGPDCRGSG